MEYPSPLTTVMIRGKEKKHSVTLPENELFRVDNIINQQEYNIPRRFLPSSPITIVDIGANVGLFAIYMQMTTSIDSIHCFEPAPATVELLRSNVDGLDRIHIYPFGLTDHEGTEPLMLDPRNTGQNSMTVSDGNMERIEVIVQDACLALDRIGLTYIDVLKVDTEGCEVPILRSLMRRLDYIGIVMLEYHCESDRRIVDHLLSRFKLIGSKTEFMDVGTLKYINKRLLKPIQET